MNLLKRNLAIGLVAAIAAAASITWVSASGVVTLYPATIEGTLNLPSETVTSIRLNFYPDGSGDAVDKTVSATAPGPYPFDLTVDGGDPDDPGDPGVFYTPYLYAYILNPTASFTYIRFLQSKFLVNNTAETPSATVPISFNYPTMHRAYTSFSVIGGTIKSYSIVAMASNHIAVTNSGSISQSSSTNWVPMVPSSNVNLTATVYVTDSTGAQSQKALSTSGVNLSTSDATVSWTIDLTNTGNLAGDVAITTPPGPTPISYDVYFQGASASTAGISGSVSVNTSVSPPHYSMPLTPGDYDVYLTTRFSNPAQTSDTERTRVTIAAGNTTTKNFTNSYGTARLNVDVGGFYNISTISTLESHLSNTPPYTLPSNYVFRYSSSSPVIDHTVSAGRWRPDYNRIGISDVSNASLPNNNSIYRWYYNDSDLPLTDILAAGVTTLGSAPFTLVKSNLYFDVIEGPYQAQVEITKPHVSAYKNEFNSDGSLRRKTIIYSSGSNTPATVTALTMVAEPGTYVLDATATLPDGTAARFGGTSIVFGEPVSSPAGTGTIELTPAQNPDLQVSLTGTVASGGDGITTVVESALGPAPPEGFSSMCQENSDGVTCDPVYYDITTNAAWSAGTKVCVRRQFSGLVNAATEFMGLWHYNETLATWELLPAPPDMPDYNGDGLPDQAIDCSADLLACGCADEASCGINLDANPPLNTFLVCGLTNSFSPFTIFQGKLKFSNTVNGVEYTGPNGPPNLQQWTVPGNGTYRITATGAEGASGTNSPSLKGGCGAEVTGDFVLQKDDVIQILVGQKGTAAPYSAGGGGGTFVLKNGTPLLIAGGGGGVRSGSTVNGRPGTVSNNGTAGSTSSGYTSGFVAGGVGGAGGARVSSYGSGGGGWSGSGASDGSYGEGGFAFLSASQSKGGSGKTCGTPAHGGYGGGGAGNGCYGGGGGGGYSGGGGGRVAGGGGSLNNGANPTGQDGKCTPHGHGSVVIDLLNHP